MRQFAYSVFLLALAVATAGMAAAAPGSTSNPAPFPQDQVAGAQTPGHIDWTPLPGPGKKVKLSDAYSLTYEFSQRPQMGTVILIIRVTDAKGTQVVPYKITGRTDMPSMRGAHDSGEVEFKTNKVNNYLLPVNIVMPGEWEVRATFSLNGAPVFHGSITFKI